MSNLSFKRYVRITSGVIGQGGTAQRELIGRIFTANARMDSTAVLEFSTSADVGDYFGYESEEYKRAQAYFGWVSPTLNTPKRLSFARYVPQEIPPRVFGGTAASLESITNLGSSATLTLTIGGVTYNAATVDVSTGISTYSDVAAAMQAALRASSSDDVITGCTVTFNSVNASFEFAGALAGNVDITVGLTPLAEAIGWTTEAGMITTSGHVQLTPVQSIQMADSLSNNYAGVVFLDNLSLQQHIQNAMALQAIDDTSYMYCMPVERSNRDQWAKAMAQIPGVAMSLIEDGDTANFADQVPLTMMAATNYNDRNATFSYMFREFPIAVTVTDDSEADACDKARVNYYGRTQEAGRTFNFYQKGYLMGPNTAPLDQSIYANEIWLKSRAKVLFMDLLKGLSELPANESGRTFGLSTLQGLVDEGLRNGVISVGKTLTTLQRAAVTTLSGDGNAWRQVQNNGYWMNVVVTSKTNEAGITEYTLEYLLIYSKKDVIRSVTGRHALV